MLYIIIADWDVSFHPTEVNYTETEAEAISLVNVLINSHGFPNSFYATNPAVPVDFIVVEPIGQTISVDSSAHLAALISIAKAAKKEEVKAERDALLAAGISATVGGGAKTFSLQGTTTGTVHMKEVRIGKSADSSSRNISAITLGNPTVIRATGNQFVLGDRVLINSVVGPTALNGRAPRITVDGGNDITVDFDTTGMDAWVSGGTIVSGEEVNDINNVIVGVTATEIASLSAIVIDGASAVGLHSVYLENQIDALTTVAAVDAFVITGWP